MGSLQGDTPFPVHLAKTLPSGNRNVMRYYMDLFEPRDQNNMTSKRSSRTYCWVKVEVGSLVKMAIDQRFPEESFDMIGKAANLHVDGALRRDEPQ